ncbi:VUT family protein [Agrobacterium tumefaciens]|uniref:VUT family protein n=1 Tax=Agrobacterium tumefaciens TaxID=358 RepID=UPI0015723A74|nr:VUT family protein [Agrobacterium tumefaciens]WCK05520.1 VUT family protein [Agrobacterium tumefaciens]
MNMRNRRWIEGGIFLVGFAACIPLANYMIGHVGTICVPNGPCLIPVGFGLTAPSGVLLVGLALVLRDLVQRRLGLLWSLGAIVVGAFLSTTFTAPSLALASASAFVTSELADLLVFTPLQKKGLVKAAFASSIVGLIVDSVMFLWLAFGSLDFLAGQVVGKLIMVVAALPVLFWIRNRDRRLGLMAA